MRMRNRGTAALLVILTVCAAAAILVTTDTNDFFAAAPPTQIYEPKAPSANEKVVCIAFDDGWKTHLEAADILERYNFTATFPIITSYVGYPAYMDWADIRVLSQKGNDIVSHTNTHTNLSSVGSATLSSELARSREVLRSKGYAADVLIYPYGEGDGNWTVRNAVAEHYLLARGAQVGKCDLDSFDRFDVTSYNIDGGTSVAEFASYLNGTQGNTITILYYHKVSDENQDNVVSKAAFQAQMQYLKDNGYAVRTISQQFLKQTS